MTNPEVLAAEINALPPRIRQYVHYLETNADPAGDKARLLCLTENNAGLAAEVERLRGELDKEIALGAAAEEAATVLRIEIERLQQLIRVADEVGNKAAMEISGLRAALKSGAEKLAAEPFAPRSVIEALLEPLGIYPDCPKHGVGSVRDAIDGCTCHERQPYEPEGSPHGQS